MTENIETQKNIKGSEQEIPQGDMAVAVARIRKLKEGDFDKLVYELFRSDESAIIKKIESEFEDKYTEEERTSPFLHNDMESVRSDTKHFISDEQRGIIKQRDEKIEEARKKFLDDIRNMPDEEIAQKADFAYIKLTEKRQDNFEILEKERTKLACRNALLFWGGKRLDFTINRRLDQLFVEKNAIDNISTDQYLWSEEARPIIASWFEKMINETKSIEGKQDIKKFLDLFLGAGTFGKRAIILKGDENDAIMDLLTTPELK